MEGSVGMMFDLPFMSKVSQFFGNCRVKISINLRLLVSALSELLADPSERKGVRFQFRFC